MNKKQRLKNRKTAEQLHLEVRKPYNCINCGQPTFSGHFVPPCFGDEGFWICEMTDADIVDGTTRSHAIEDE